MITTLMAAAALILASVALVMAARQRRVVDEQEIRLEVVERLFDLDSAEEKPAAPAEAHLDYSIVEDAARARAARDAARGAR